jgi:uncharacterized protein (DUF2147 family)
MFVPNVKSFASFMLAAAIEGATFPASAVADVVGVWWTPKRDGKIEITRDFSGIVSGRIIAGRAEDANKRDEKNPDEGMRRKRILGLKILEGFRQGNDGKWSGGSIYDPESGSTYSGTIWREGTDRLVMRGFLGISLLGRTEILTRVSGPQPTTAQSGEPALTHVQR